VAQPPTGPGPDDDAAALPDGSEVAARVALVRARMADGSMELVGESHGAPVVVVPPDPVWIDRFRRTRDAIAGALGETALRIEHVGSTAVPGLAAKPIIDVQVSVPDVADEGAYAPALAALGWPLRMREEDHRFFRDPAGVPRATHVHVCPLGSEWEARHLLFRDYLRAHPERTAAYGALKLALAERYRLDGVAYTEAKGPFIEETLAMADRWAVAIGWQA
jgi:GrpB-like predicted nucleotidyltransferase (UPF0157 family)